MRSLSLSHIRTHIRDTLRWPRPLLEMYSSSCVWLSFFRVDLHNYWGLDRNVDIRGPGRGHSLPT